MLGFNKENDFRNEQCQLPWIKNCLLRYKTSGNMTQRDDDEYLLSGSWLTEEDKAAQDEQARLHTILDSAERLLHTIHEEGEEEHGDEEEENKVVSVDDDDNYILDSPLNTTEKVNDVEIIDLSKDPSPSTLAPAETPDIEEVSIITNNTEESQVKQGTQVTQAAEVATETPPVPQQVSGIVSEKDHSSSDSNSGYAPSTSSMATDRYKYSKYGTRSLVDEGDIPTNAEKPAMSSKYHQCKQARDAVMTHSTVSVDFDHEAGAAEKMKHPRIGSLDCTGDTELLRTFRGSRINSNNTE